MDEVKVVEPASELAKAAKAPKVKWDNLDVPIEHSGRAITLPGDPGKMPLAKAIEALQRKQKDEETKVIVHEIIDAFPLDGAVAFVKAMQNLYGWASPVATPGFFGPRPPQIISVKTGPNKEDVVQCPLGAFILPGVEEPVKTICPWLENGKAVFLVHAEIKQKEKHLLLELANEARRIVKEQSIYKGKAIRLAVSKDDDGQMVIDMANPPEFMDVSDISEADLLFNDDVRAQIETNILVPLRNIERCRKLKIPLKRGIGLEGQYGTGKSLTARLTAKVATDHGWTFVLLDRVQGLRQALEFANRYAPAVVFAEDIDRIAAERDEEANDLINTIDGVVSKRAEIMTILTTNFVEKLDPVILRPGRLDAVISLHAPNAATVQKLIRHYAGNLLAKDEDLSSVGRELEGQIPASIRECVERAKLGMVGRDDNKIVSADLMIAAQTMKNHLALLNRKSAEETEPEKLAKSLKNVIGNGTIDSVKLIERKVRELHEHII